MLSPEWFLSDPFLTMFSKYISLCNVPLYRALDSLQIVSYNIPLHTEYCYNPN